MIRKGTRVYSFIEWDRKGTILVQEFTVGSWGKAWGHLVDGAGDNAERRIYVQQINHVSHYMTEHVYPVSEIADVQAKGLELAEISLRLQREQFDRCFADANAGEAYHAQTRKELAALHAPTVLVRS